MSGYLIVMAMLIVALIAVLLAFLIDHDEDASLADHNEMSLSDSDPTATLRRALTADENERVEDDG